MALSTSASTRLQYQHKTIPELIDGLNEVALRQNPQPGKWSAFDNIAHLAAYQQIFLTRLERIKTEDAPAFERYVGDNDPLFLQYQQWELKTLLYELEECRAVVAATAKGASEVQLNSVALHPKYGALNVIGWTEFFLLHEAHHLFTIFKLVQEIRQGA